MGQFTPPEAPIHVPQQLPVIPPRQIVGRNRELGQAYSQIRAGMPVVLHGPSGVGKSALAAMIATAYTTFKGGVLWWSVAGDDFSSLVARLGRAYGDEILAGIADPARQLERATALLSAKPLIVLDDLDDFDAAREFVRKIAASVPLIITSDQGASGPWIPFAIGSLSQSDGEALLVQTARIDPASIKRGVVPRLCALLGGVPLELVLAGRHIAAGEQTPADFLDVLEAVDETRTGLVSLAVVFDWLPDPLKRLLVTLGGSFAGQASAATLAAMQLESPAEVGREMEGLLQRGLASALPQRDGAPAFATHPQVQHFVQEWLRRHGRLDAMRARWQEALLTHAWQQRANTPEAQAALAAELPNLLAMARYAAGQDDTDTAAQVMAALEAAFGGSGAYRHEQATLEALIAGPAEMEQVAPEEDVLASPQEALADFMEDGLYGGAETGDLLDDLAPSAEAFELWDEDALADDEDEAEFEPALSSTVDVLADFVDDGFDAPADIEDLMDEVIGFDDGVAELDAAFSDDDGAPEPVHPIAAGVETWEAVDSGAPAEVPVESATRHAPGLDDLLKMSRDARRSGDRGRLAATLVLVGRAWTERGQYDQARAALDEALAVHQERNDERGMLEALEALAAVSLETGDLDSAVVYATRADNLASQAANAVRHGHVLALLGDIRLELGELDEAVRTYVAAIEALQVAGDPVSLGVVQAKLGATHMDRGDFTRAVTMLSSARAIFSTAGLDEYEERVLGNLGMAYGQLGQWREAETYHRQALLIAERLDDTVEQEQQLANLGYAAHAQQKWDAMQVHYRAALDLAYRSGNTEWQVRYLDVLGQNLMDTAAQVGLAVALLEEAERLQPDPERERLLGRARKRLMRLEQSGTPLEPVPVSIAEWAAGVHL